MFFGKKIVAEARRLSDSGYSVIPNSRYSAFSILYHSFTIGSNHNLVANHFLLRYATPTRLSTLDSRLSTLDPLEISLTLLIMTSVTTSLAKALPKPKYTAEHEDLLTHSKGPRILGPGSLDETQVVLKVSPCLSEIVAALTLLTPSQRSGPPSYGSRAGWRPRSVEDYDDGGAFPEIPVAQYPLDMGRKSSSSSNALAVQLDAEGKVKYDAIARQGHNDKRIVHTSFQDLIPLRQKADVGEISLDRPSEEEIAAQTEKTKDALAKLVSGAVAAQKPKNVKGITRNDPTYVRYTPANQMGDVTRKNDRIMKIVERQQDPMEPPKFK